MTTIQQVKTTYTKDVQYSIPQNWQSVAGILKGKKCVNSIKYQKEIRREWDKRFKRQNIK